MGAAQTFSKTHQEPTQAQWNALRANTQKLQQELDTERARTSKLRRYIAGLNHSSKAPSHQQEDATLHFASAVGLRKLTEQQGQLLDKLYSECTQQQAEIERVTKLNKQLLVANEKLRHSMLTLKKRAREKCAHDEDTGLTLSERAQKLSTASTNVTG